MPLTDTAVRNAKPRPKQYTLFDEKGLFLLVAPNGGRWWRLKYRFAGKEKRLSLGTYPEVSLKEARDARDDARADLRKGIDPALARKQEKADQAADQDTFEKLAREWHERFSPGWSTSHAETTLERLVKNIFPWVGSRPVREITPQELLAVLRRMEGRGALESAHRLRGVCSMIFRYGIATGQAERDPAADLRGALPPKKEQHRAAITDPREVAPLLRAIDGYPGSFVVCSALKLAPLVFVRPGELRHAEWTEVDLDAAEWRIPGDKMKMGEKHIVPLSSQAAAILRELHPLTGHGKYVFPSIRTAARPMSEATILVALRRLGYAKHEMTGHGFRSMASTLLHEQGWPSDVIERQLAHGERNKVKAAYNFAEHLPERRRMMQEWSDYLDGLKAGVK